MKTLILYLVILILPFLGVIVINEFSRKIRVEEGYNSRGVVAINSARKHKSKCSWVCHNTTNYCKKNHVKFADPYFDKIDPIYFGIINNLNATGKYRLGNILLFVILFPLMMYLLLIKSISIQFEINKIIKD